MISFLTKQKQTLITLLFIVIIVGSCTKPKSKLAAYGSVFENVMRTETGVFRGFSLGDKMDSVKLKEPVKPIETDSGYLYYEMKLDTTGSFNITYNFDDNGLDEIQSDIFINNAAKADDVFAKFKTYFDEHYGASESRQGCWVWTVKSEKYGIVRINLRDENPTTIAENPPSGKISLWIYPDKE